MWSKHKSHENKDKKKEDRVEVKNGGKYRASKKGVQTAEHTYTGRYWEYPPPPPSTTPSTPVGGAYTVMSACRVLLKTRFGNVKSLIYNTHCICT